MNEEKRLHLPCDVVRDLLPLYHDGVVRDATAAAVREHMDRCEDCRREYEVLREALPEAAGKGKTTLTRFRELLKQQKRKKIVAIILAAVLAAVAAAGGVAVLSDACIVQMSSSKYEIQEICRIDTDQGPQFLLRYSDTYGGIIALTSKTVEQDGAATLDLRLRHPPLTWQMTGEHIERPGWFFIPDEGFDAVTFNGETVWTAEENDVPGYADSFWEWYQALWKNDGGAAAYDFTDDYVYLQFPDGHEEYWSYDGGRLDEPPASPGQEMDWSLEVPPPAVE